MKEEKHSYRITDILSVTDNIEFYPKKFEH